MSFFPSSTTLFFSTTGGQKALAVLRFIIQCILLDRYSVAYLECRQSFSSRKASTSFDCAVGCVGSPCGSQIKVTSVINPQQYFPVSCSGTSEATCQHTMSEGGLRSPSPYVLTQSSSGRRPDLLQGLGQRGAGVQRPSGDCASWSTTVLGSCDGRRARKCSGALQR